MSHRGITCEIGACQLRQPEIRRDTDTHTTTAPPVWRAPEGPEGTAAAPVAAGPGRATYRHLDRLEAAARPAGPGRTHLQHSTAGAAGVEGRRRAWRVRLRCPWAVAGPGRASRRRTKHTPAHRAPLVWRAPEGPEGTGGLRGAAPNEVRPPSLAGGRALRRPEHPWGHKQPGPSGGLAAAGDLSGQQEGMLEVRCPRRSTAPHRPEIRRRRNQTKSGGPQENLGTTTHAFTCVN